MDWLGSFRKLLSNPAAPPPPHVPGKESNGQRRDIIAKIIQFGIPRTDTARHECLPGAQVDALANSVATMRKKRR
jgi:hypothetical protein